MSQIYRSNAEHSKERIHYSSLSNAIHSANTKTIPVLVTGGAGYIGSHTVIELIEAGFEPIIFDNFSNASHENIHRIEQITGRAITVIEGDIRSHEDLRKVFDNHPIQSVIHFAGFKTVGESAQQPLKYYDNNVHGTIVLCEVMAEYDCKQMVFSSSAAVYGEPAYVPIKEDFPLSATNRYGQSKLMIEKILHDLYVSDNDWRIVLLRFFNPVGAHPSGLIGENPKGTPSNLVPYITQTAMGNLECLNIFGSDYDTPDGTGVRDYIHVIDLADAHVKALDYIHSSSFTMQNSTFNIGTGQGYSVLEMVQAFEKASGKEIPYCIAPRRPGDIASCYADPSLANEVLDWRATRSLQEMCADTWRWQSANQEG
jgi:UDP-glucose 4-epimerase